LRSLRQKKRQWIMVKRNVHKVFRANPPRTLRKNFAFIASKKNANGSWLNAMFTKASERTHRELCGKSLRTLRQKKP